MDSLFTKIINGEIPAVKVYEDEHVYAFLDINPVSKGHTLVVPKKPCEGLLDCDPEILASLIKAVQKIARAVKAAAHADGINIMQNDGAAAGQKVFHLHFHVIPRFENDGFTHWKGTPYQDEAEAEGVAEQIKKELVGRKA
jgi:histidine triad (HIT) family protein